MNFTSEGLDGFCKAIFYAIKQEPPKYATPLRFPEILMHCSLKCEKSSSIYNILGLKYALLFVKYVRSGSSMMFLFVLTLQPRVSYTK